MRNMELESKMPDFSINGLLEQHLRVRMDNANLFNENNASVYSQTLLGEIHSNSIEYLMNLGFMQLHDVKSIGMFNEMNLAANQNSMKGYEEILDDSTIALPKRTKRLRTSLQDCLEKRHSCRQFSSQCMDFRDCSSILEFSFGESRRTQNYGGIEVHSRYYASGGGLYPIRVFIYVNRVDSIPQGLYLYQPRSHSLHSINTSQIFESSELFQGGALDLDNYSFIVFYEYDINRNYLKYGELALLLASIEVGIMSQNFELLCTACGYSACQVAGFDKRYAEKVIGLDGVNSHVLFTNICGIEQ